MKNFQSEMRKTALSFFSCLHVLFRNFQKPMARNLCSIDVYNSLISMKINPFYILAPPSFKLNGVIQKLWGNPMWVYKGLISLNQQQETILKSNYLFKSVLVYKFEAATPSLKPVQTIFLSLTINQNLQEDTVLMANLSVQFLDLILKSIK